jgi:hypothetical protein
MRRLIPAVILVAGLAVLLVPQARAELLSKRYEFQAGVLLALGSAESTGLRLDTVRFQLPASVDGRIVRAAGPVTARIEVSNTGTTSRRVGLAIALFDAEGRLLGAASGGSQLAPIKPGRQKSFELLFDGVNAEAGKATAFQISLEPKP